MSNETSTTDTITFARIPDSISTRLDSWVESKQHCWVIFATQNGVWVRSFGTLSKRGAVYTLDDDESMSGVTFPIGTVESVGQSCIFLR